MSTEKCIVMGCPNHKNEGGFVGDLCAPCYGMLSTGKLPKMPPKPWSKWHVGQAIFEQGYIAGQQMERKLMRMRLGIATKEDADD